MDMDGAAVDARVRQCILPAIESNTRGTLSTAVVRVKEPVALQLSENSFIEKTLHYISSIPGCVKSGLVLSTNTKYPRRYIIAIRGMPVMSLEDFQNIRDTNDNIRDIFISTVEECIRIDVWRAGQGARKSTKRHRPKSAVVMSCDLSAVDKRDHKCLRQLMLRLNAMHEIECQFEVRVDTSQTDYYELEADILDRMSLAALETIMHECRAFCHDIKFDFPHKVVRIQCLKLAAPLRSTRRILRIKNKSK